MRLVRLTLRNHSPIRGLPVRFARALATCVGVLNSNEVTPKPSAETINGYVTDAIDLISKAISMSDRSVDELLAANEFAPLREYEAFQALGR